MGWFAGNAVSRLLYTILHDWEQQSRTVNPPSKDEVLTLRCPVSAQLSGGRSNARPLRSEIATD